MRGISRTTLFINSVAIPADIQLLTPDCGLLQARRHGNVRLLSRGALCLPLLRQTPGSEARRVSTSLLLDRFKGIGGLVQALLHSCVGFGVIVNRLTTSP